MFATNQEIIYISLLPYDQDGANEGIVCHGPHQPYLGLA
jgi:hypothetical protein